MKVSHLKEGLCSWGPSLEHDREDGEDNDLNGSSSGIPVRTTNTILKIVGVKLGLILNNRNKYFVLIPKEDK